MDKPQLKFKVPVDNEPTPFIPTLKNKPNALVPLSVYPVASEDGNHCYCNPYEYEIDHLPTPRALLTKAPPIIPDPLDSTHFVFVKDEEKLNSMMHHLENEKEFAVDLENHSYHSFHGFTCLIQISTRSTDYIIDAIELRDKLTVLNDVFTDPKILKVFHGAECDILWLQRDFSVYVVNMFDTRHAAEVLKLEKQGLAFLLEKFCRVQTTKDYQLHDWRIRPLSNDALKYARIDTHYLLYIYDILRNHLLDYNGIQAVFEKSSALCKQRYNKDILTDKSYLKVVKSGKSFFNNRQMFALKHLYNWRDSTARTEDESPGYILPNQTLISIAKTLPYDADDIFACCRPTTASVRTHLEEIQKIIELAEKVEIVENKNGKKKRQYNGPRR